MKDRIADFVDAIFEFKSAKSISFRACVRRDGERGIEREPLHGPAALYAVCPFLCAIPNGSAWDAHELKTGMSNCFACPRKAVGHGTPNRLFCRHAVENDAIEAEVSARTTLRENGTARGCRAEALPKVRTLFEGAQPFRKLRILENPEDSFEDPHPVSKMRTENCTPSRAERCQTEGCEHFILTQSPLATENTTSLRISRCLVCC